MFPPHASPEPVPAALRRRWWGALTLSLVLLCGALVGLKLLWVDQVVHRWFLLSAVAVGYVLLFARRHLAQHRRGEASSVLRTLGLGSRITLFRGCCYALLAGFIVVPEPPGRLAWIPGILYLGAAVTDYVDGFLARRRNQATPFGARIDMAYDALGVLVATTLCVRYGRLPDWYLLLGGAFYLFEAYRYGLQRLGKAVYPLPPSVQRRVIGGFQVGFLCVVLFPVFEPPATALAALLFAVPFGVSFLRDAFVVGGGAERYPVAYRRVRRGIRLLLRWLPVGLRGLLVVVGVWWLPIAWQLGGAVSVGVTLAASGMVAAGAASRVAATALLVLACLDLLAAGLGIHNGLLLSMAVGIMLLGAGALASWTPEDVVLRPRGGRPAGKIASPTAQR